MSSRVASRPAARPRTGRSGTRAPRARASRAPYLFLLPLLAVFAGFYIWPALNTIAGSFFRWGLLNPWSFTAPGEWDFVALENYLSTLTSPRFWNAALNTAIWLVLFPLLVTGVSLLVAVAIWYLPVGARVFRTIFLLPMTISLAAAGVIWTFVYDPDFGVLTAALDAVGLTGTLEWGPVRLEAGNWLSDPGALTVGPVELRFVNVALVVAGAWAFTGFGVITITAGLTSVPEELVEAARIDGARTRQIVRHVLVPSLRGPLVIVATISVIFALRTFDIVWVITQGGPAQDSEVLAVLLWKQAFVFLDSPQAGLATAVAVLMSLALVVSGYRYLRAMLEGER